MTEDARLIGGQIDATFSQKPVSILFKWYPFLCGRCRTLKINALRQRGYVHNKNPTRTDRRNTSAIKPGALPIENWLHTVKRMETSRVNGWPR